ncbi:MAG TPA: hypothetical protein VMU14_06225 [Acidimicrobiales bacterium]|nr:hypothetical protein [Acidimicrobiales bacterium]
MKVAGGTVLAVVLVLVVIKASATRTGTSSTGGGEVASPSAVAGPPLQPAGQSGGFISVEISTLPLLPGSVKAGPVSSTASTRAESFFLSHTTPRDAVVA